MSDVSQQSQPGEQRNYQQTRDRSETDRAELVASRRVGFVLVVTITLLAWVGVIGLLWLLLL